MPDDAPNQTNQVQKSFIGQILTFANAHTIVQLRSLIVLPVLTRLLGAEGLGSIAPIIALNGLVQAVVIMGTNTSLTVFIPRRNPKTRAGEFWGVFQLTFLISLAVLLLLVIFFPFIRSSLLNESTSFNLYLLGLLLIPAQSLQLILYAQIINNQLGREYMSVVLLNTAFDITATIGFSFLWGAFGMLFAMVLSQSLLAYLTFRIVKSVDKFVPLSAKQFTGLKIFYSYGLLIFIAGFASNLVANSDRLIINRLLTVEDVGVYDVVYQLTAKLNQLAAPIFATLMPFVVTSIEQKNQEKAVRFFKDTGRILLFIFLPIITLYLIEARDVLTVLTTADFLPGITIIPWIAIGILFAQLVGIYNYNLHAHGKGGLLIISLVIGAMVNILLNIVFVPLYGYVAAAISTLIAYLVIFFINRAFSGQYLAIPWDFRFLGKVLVSCLFMGFICTQIRDFFPWNGVMRLFTVTGSGMLLYFLSIKPLNLLNKEERSYVLSAAKSVFYIRPKTVK